MTRTRIDPGRARVALAFAAAFVALAAALAGAPRAAPAAGSEGSAGGVVPAAADELMEALALTGDVEAGRHAFASCASCHLASGAGRPDGTFPQLAGQHTTVLIKQIADIRAGRRHNPVMLPFAQSLIDSRELADVAAYIETLPIPNDNGKGAGEDLARGEILYRRDCVACHGDRGQGDAEAFYPVLAGQHYKYLLRQARDIAGGRRRNADPGMVQVVRDYDDDELIAVVDYASRLRWPERQAEE